MCARESDLQDLQPLVLTFDLPVTLVGGVVCDTGSPVIQHVAQVFGVSVSFRTQPKLYCSTCSVRGTQGNTTVVKVTLAFTHDTAPHAASITDL